ncbi:uncharacterized protein B0H18DRAFT_1122909 [Fomitopsis serialis]|uniref:uncharacterized protein n=1 Tax=Fomitopsis serialis TaxID=139415 RepID=UPI002008C0A3|nr:uncharacterized protein B0H18DRAFT_1122909 [Neoantrodia serialis]KAH9918652.1 hypothetical protein B0H18DRAFT_1122909 [Neoantrodia serialis]
MQGDRKASYKVPPAAVRDPLSSQEHRRNKQKRRRAERFDSSRQLDFFADLTLGPSDDEVDEGDGQDGPEIVRQGVSHFVGMLPAAREVSSASSSAAPISESAVPAPQTADMQTSGKKRGKSKRRAKPAPSSSGPSKRKPNRWADKCMYAELLEMSEDYDAYNVVSDGIPQDIAAGWVAVTPVPVGKRCLAVTHQTSGLPGLVPNLTLRSRVLGKPLMKPFASPLPPHTVLDCILDENWKDNGILHVLDVLKWKEQDITECETPFRFWWRDTRLSELPVLPPPANAADQGEEPTAIDAGVLGHYRFPHPATFVTVFARHLGHKTRNACPQTSGMDLDIPAPLITELETVPVEIKSDGLLLYVAQATYEPGTSPLSSWVPLRAYAQAPHEPSLGTGKVTPESPLNVFERLVRRRLALKEGASIGSSMIPEVSMEEDM